MELAPGLLVPRDAGVGLALLVGQLADLVVEAGDGDPPVGIGQAGQHADQHVGRVLAAVAVAAGVDVLGRAGDLQLPVGDAAQAVGDGRRALVVVHVRVADDGQVGLQQVGPAGDELLHRQAAHLLVALEEEAQVERQPIGSCQPGLRRLEVHEELALVVARAAGVDPVVLVARLERRSDPLVQRVRRLDVVVAIDEHGGRVRAGVQPVAGDDRVAARLVQLRVVDPDPGQLVGHPLRGAAHVVPAVGIGADRLDAQELVQAAHVLVGVVAQVGKGGVDAARPIVMGR